MTRSQVFSRCCRHRLPPNQTLTVHCHSRSRRRFSKNSVGFSNLFVIDRLEPSRRIIAMFRLARYRLGKSLNLPSCRCEMSWTVHADEMICFYFCGLADEDELIKHIEKLKPQNAEDCRHPHVLRLFMRAIVTVPATTPQATPVAISRHQIPIGKISRERWPNDHTIKSRVERDWARPRFFIRVFPLAKFQPLGCWGQMSDRNSPEPGRHY